MLTDFHGNPPPPVRRDGPVWLSAALHTLARAYARADGMTQGLLSRLARAWTRFNARDTRQAASLAYYGVFSLFPLLLLGVTLSNTVFGPDVTQQQVMRLIQRFFPGDTMTLVEPNLALALAQGQSFGVVAVLGLLWSASSLFANLSVALDTIFHPAHPPRTLWRHRRLALGIMIVLGLLLSGSLLASVGFRSLGTLLLERPGTLMRIGSIVIPLSLDMAILALLFRHVPRITVPWRAVLPAALMGSLGWELSKSVFVWYLENLANFSVLYGSLGTVIALMVWAYVSAALLLLSAEVCVAINDWLGAQEQSSRP